MICFAASSKELTGAATEWAEQRMVSFYSLLSGVGPPETHWQFDVKVILEGNTFIFRHEATTGTLFDYNKRFPLQSTVSVLLQQQLPSYL